MNKYFFLLLLTVFLNTTANLLIKKGALKIIPLSFSFSNIISFIFQVATNIFIMSGLIIFAAGFFLWVAVLSKIQVSIAAPLMSISYILITIFAYFFLKEPLTLSKILGILIIILGIYLITR
jgi:drug/metabolite transporter (DMT)-like permease